MSAIVDDERRALSLGRVDLNLLIALEALLDEANVTHRLNLQEYMRQPHAVYQASARGGFGMADRTIRDTNLPRRVQVSVDSFVLLPLLLQGTPQVALIQERLGRKLAALADVRLVEPLFDTPPLAEAMYWHSRNTCDPAHRWLRTMLRKVAAELTP